MRCWRTARSRGSAPKADKRSYFIRRLQGRVELREFRRLTFGAGAESRHRYFPDKLPVGIQADQTDHVFMYLITSPMPMDFRLFLLRHAELLRSLYHWTIRVLDRSRSRGQFECSDTRPAKSSRLRSRLRRRKDSSGSFASDNGGRRRRQNRPTSASDRPPWPIAHHASEPCCGGGSRMAIPRSGPRSLRL